MSKSRRASIWFPVRHGVDPRLILGRKRAPVGEPSLSTRFGGEIRRAWIGHPDLDQLHAALAHALAVRPDLLARGLGARWFVCLLARSLGRSRTRGLCVQRPGTIAFMAISLVTCNLLRATVTNKRGRKV